MAEIEFLTVGNEILSGATEDTNFSFAARELVSAGIVPPRKRTSVGDSRKDIVAALRDAAKADFTVVCGGLGPTPDDLTASCAAESFGVPLETDVRALEMVEDALKKIDRRVLPSHKKQAEFPSGAESVPNSEGVAPGFMFKSEKAVFYFLPGVPAEFRAMLKDFALPDIIRRGGAGSFSIKAVSIFGVPESEIARRIESMDTGEVDIAYRLREHEIQVRVSHPRNSPEVKKVAGEIKKHFASAAFSTGGETLTEAVARALSEKKLTVATAESCTGGTLAGKLTGIAGSSAWFPGGVVSYSNESKTDTVGVPAALIEKEGAVSAAVAEAMAEGVRKRFGASIGVGITGIAGPGGGSFEKPVGTVYIATSAGNSGGEVSKFEFRGKRSRIRESSVAAALEMVMRLALLPGGAEKNSE
ncbi:MAG: CinA family nicotinamide mononucleotide deamidase-related protein [Thermodesulfobacteriota bacterium]